MTNNIYRVSAKDREVLRKLGARIAEIGNTTVMNERRSLWKKLNALEAQRPMLLCELSEITDEIVPPHSLKCEGEWAKAMERRLRSQIYHFENVGDDFVIEPRITYGYKVKIGNFGFEPVVHSGSRDGVKGSYKVEPPIRDIEEGMEKLHFRELDVDREATENERAALEHVFGGILPVEHRGWYFWTQGLTISVIDLIGLDGLMYAMYDQPEALHRLMAFMRDEQIHFLKWFEKQGLLFPNNQDDYIGSGGCGYTDLLPQKDNIPCNPGRLADMWGLSESQETVGVSPDMFNEFVFQYQLPIISMFGFACYGCCEPLDKRWHVVKQIPNLRRVSVSPWADQEKMADYLDSKYVYSRKPNPTLVSTRYWDEKIIREDIRKSLDIAGNLNMEIILKDVHTLFKEPDRLSKWTRIVRVEIDRKG